MARGQSPLCGFHFPLCIPSLHLLMQRHCEILQGGRGLSPCSPVSKTPVPTGPAFQRAYLFIPQWTAVGLHYSWASLELQECLATTLSFPQCKHLPVMSSVTWATLKTALRSPSLTPFPTMEITCSSGAT